MGGEQRWRDYTVNNRDKRAKKSILCDMINGWERSYNEGTSEKSTLIPVIISNILSQITSGEPSIYPLVEQWKWLYICLVSFQ